MANQRGTYARRHGIETRVKDMLRPTRAEERLMESMDDALSEFLGVRKRRRKREDEPEVARSPFRHHEQEVREVHLRVLLYRDAVERGRREGQVLAPKGSDDIREALALMEGHANRRKWLEEGPEPAMGIPRLGTLPDREC